MFCTNCGQPHHDGAATCPQCGAAVPPFRTASGVPIDIPRHIGLAILSAFFFLPLGIAAMVYAVRVDDRVAAGDLNGAERAGRRAALSAKLAIMTGIGSYVVLFVIALLRR